MTIDRLASLVTYDLQNLGHTDITYGRTVPYYQGTYSIVAIRKNSDDYHMMWMHSSQPTWRHKPHNSAILQYGYSLLTYGTWTDEGLFQAGYETYNNIYDSDIIYIKYKN